LVALPLVTDVAALADDIVELTSGNRLIGTVRSLYRGNLDFSISGAGRVSIDWDNVETLESPRTMDVELQSGERVEGAISSPAAMQLEVASPSGPRRLEMQDVVRIHPIEPLLRDRLEGDLDVGFAALGANDEIDITLNGGIEHRTANFLTKGSLSVYFRRLDDTTVQDRKNLEASTRRFIRNRWFWIAQIGYQNDDALDLDSRRIIGAGAGRTLRQTNRAILALYAGVDYAVERYAVLTETDRSPELFGSMEWDWFHVGGDIEVSTKLSVYSNLDRNRKLVQLDASLRREFFDNYYWSFTVFEIYDQNPPPGAADHDEGLTFGVGRSF
jgi:hypothetical protein